MSSSVPINSLNAIDVSSFVIAFDRNFSDEEINGLLSLEKELEEYLPVFSQERSFTAMLENDTITEQAAKKSGVKLQRMEPNGKPSWVLNVIENQIVVSCHAYDRWQNVWERTDGFIQAVINLLDIETLKIQFFALQYVDRFIDDQSDYNIHGVFGKNTKYLTTQALESGNLWHVHQGWFDKVSKDKRTLNVLNLGAAAEKDKNITTIDHVAHMQFREPIPAEELLLSSDKKYEKIFLELHKNNKSIIRDLINKQQKKAIKLDV